MYPEGSINVSVERAEGLEEFITTRRLLIIGSEEPINRLDS